MITHHKGHNPISPAAIVRHGFTRRERVAVYRRDERMMTALRENYDAAVVNQICELCDRFVAKHGKDEERRR